MSGPERPAGEMSEEAAKAEARAIRERPEVKAAIEQTAGGGTGALAVSPPRPRLWFGVAAALGRWLTGSDAWFLALPAALALAWLGVANPAACDPTSVASREATDRGR